jgi:carboxypeptidase T
MKQRTSWKIWSACGVLVGFALTLVGSFATWGGSTADYGLNNARAYPWAFSTPGSGTQTEENDGILVIQLTYSDRAALDLLTAWKEPWEVNPQNRQAVFEVSRMEYEMLLAAGYQVEILPDLTEQLNTPRLALPGQTSGIPGFMCYRTVAETYASAEQMVTTYPLLAEWIDIGDTWQKIQGSGGYDLFVLRLTNELITLPKPKLFIMSSIHARELTPAELNTRFAELLLAGYGRDADLTWLLDYTEIHLLLQANPDGRIIVEEDAVYWRKNTNNAYCTTNPSAWGADLNRNFSFAWGLPGGASSIECYETYQGPSAASEPETQAVEMYVKSIYPDVREADQFAPAPSDTTGLFMDLHSYSKLVLWPWGYWTDPAPNGEALQILGRKLAFFNQYTPQQAVDLYRTSGTTDDFAYGELGVAAYTFELGERFFEPCDEFENEILPANLPALVYAAKAAHAPYLLPGGPDAVNPTFASPLTRIGDPAVLTVTLDTTRFYSPSGGNPVTTVAGGEVYLDIPPFTPGASPIGELTALDGSFDSAVESAQILLDTSALSPGQHTVFIRGKNTDGQWGVITAIFIYQNQVSLPFIANSPPITP